MFVQHIAIDPDPGAPFALGSAGAQLHDRLQPEPHDLRIAKTSANAFFQSWLQPMLLTYDVSELVIAGEMTQTCIDSIARGALDFGYAVSVASDACVAGALEHEGKALRRRGCRKCSWRRSPGDAGQESSRDRRQRFRSRIADGRQLSCAPEPG